MNDHPPHVNRPAGAIPSLQNPSTTLPSSSSVALTPNLGSTVSYPNTCVNVSTDNPPPRKKKLPPGHPKGKMKQRDDTKESREDPISNGSIQTDTPAEEETTVVEVTPPPSPETRTGNETIPEDGAAEQEKHTTPTREAATAPGPRSDNSLNITTSEGSKSENQSHWPKYVDMQEEQSTTPRRPLVKNIPEVLNLSSKPLTEMEKEVLSLGLGFAPTERKTPDLRKVS